MKNLLFALLLFSLCTSAFGQEKNISEGTPDGTYGGKGQVQGVKEPSVLFYRYYKGEVIGVWMNPDESDRPQGILYLQSCFRGKVKNNSIINSDVDLIKRDANNFQVIYKNVTRNYLQFENTTYYPTIPTDYLKTCIDYYENPKRKPECGSDICAPPPYRIVFVGRDADPFNGNLVPHAYIILEKYNSTTKTYDKHPFGFFPRERNLKTVFSVKGVKGLVREDDPVINLNKKRYTIFRIAISEETYRKVETAINKWSSQAEEGTVTYNLFMKNCVSFTEMIAKTVGDAESSKASCDFTRKLKVRDSFFPADLITYLNIDNPGREVPDVLNCITEKPKK